MRAILLVHIFDSLSFMFAGSPFLRDDTRLRALRFLDHMLVRICIFPVGSVYGGVTVSTSSTHMLLMLLILFYGPSNECCILVGKR